MNRAPSRSRPRVTHHRPLVADEDRSDMPPANALTADSGVGFAGSEAPAATLAVALESIADDGEGLGCRADVIHLHRFAFELLVVLKEPPQHEQAVRRHFLGLPVSIELRVLGGDRNDLVVLLASINHGHHPDAAGV